MDSKVGGREGREGREGHRRRAGMADTTSRQDEAEAERVQTLRDDEGARSWPAKMRADELDLDTQSRERGWDRSWGRGEGDSGYVELQ